MASEFSPMHSRTRPSDGVHTPIAYIYADESSRLNVNPDKFNDYDIYKVCLQLDTKQLFWLESYTPVIWQPFGGSGGTSTDMLVKATFVDSTAGYLGEKVGSADGTINLTIGGGSGDPQYVNFSVSPGTSVQKLSFAKNGTDVADRPKLNLIEGSNVTLTVTDNPTDNRVDVTVASTGGGGGTDQYVKVDASDTTAAYLDSKLQLALGLTKSIGSPAGNETLIVSMPAGATNNVLRYTGSVWATDSRLTTQGSGAASGNGSVTVTGISGDTSTSSLYSLNATTDPTKYAIKAESTSGASGLSVISNSGTGAYIETTTGNAQGLMVKSNGGGSADAVYIQKNAASGTGTFLHFDNMTANTIMDFPSDGSIRFWGVGGAAGSTQIKPQTTFSSNIVWTLPAAQGGSNTFLKNDGSGNLSWASSTATPGGSTTQVQYNNAGAFGGISGVTTNGTALTTLTVAGTSTIAGSTSVNTTGTSATVIGHTTNTSTVSLRSGIEIRAEASPGNNSSAGSVLGVYAIPDSGTPTTGFGSAISFYADSDTTANQPIGALQYVWTNATHAARTSAADIRLTQNATSNQLAWTFKLGSVIGQSTSGSALTLAIPSGLTTHTLTMPTAQGSSNTFLKNDGSGNLSWATGAAGTPGGSDTHVQFNNAGAFGGSSNFTWNNSTPQLTVAGTISFNSTGGKAMTFGSNGSNLGGKLTIPANGASSILIQTCPTGSTGQGFAVVTADGVGNNNGGTISLLTGVEAGTGYGGSVTINTGGTNNSGAVSITTGSVDNIAGNITIEAGNTVSGVGGTVNIYAGASTSTVGAGGDVNISAGNSGTTTGAGGSVLITSGSSTNGSGSGGITLVAALSGNSSTDGGSVQIYGGDALGTRTGGSVVIAPGGNGSGGTYGKISIGTNSGHRLTFFGGSGAAKGSAITQTYATTGNTLSKVNAAGDISSLAIGAAYNQAEVQALRNKTEDLASDLRTLTNVFNQLLDTIQSYNLI